MFNLIRLILRVVNVTLILTAYGIAISGLISIVRHLVMMIIKLIKIAINIK